MPFGRLTPGRPIGHHGLGCPSGVFGGFSYYQLVIFFFNIVPLIMEFTAAVLFIFTIPVIWLVFNEV
jgi:hypothetical protein